MDSEQQKNAIVNSFVDREENKNRIPITREMGANGRLEVGEGAEWEGTEEDGQQGVKRLEENEQKGGKIRKRTER